jgi:hypothetical protein
MKEFEEKRMLNVLSVKVISPFYLKAEISLTPDTGKNIQRLLAT